MVTMLIHFISKAYLVVLIVGFARPAPIKAMSAQLIFAPFAAKPILSFPEHFMSMESSKGSLL